MRCTAILKHKQEGTVAAAYRCCCWDRGLSLRLLGRLLGPTGDVRDQPARPGAGRLGDGRAACRSSFGPGPGRAGRRAAARGGARGAACVMNDTELEKP